MKIPNWRSTGHQGKKIGGGQTIRRGYCFKSGEENVTAKVKELTGGIGCDVYIEATGFPKASNRPGHD